MNWETGSSPSRHRRLSIAAVFLCSSLSLYVFNPLKVATYTITWIDLGCMHPASRGSIGADSGVGAFRGLGYTNWHASVMKKFQFGGDSHRLAQVRFEAYNVFNHTEWSGINLTPSFSPTTGQIANLVSRTTGQGGGIFGFGALNAIRAGSPRVVQLGAKVYF